MKKSILIVENDPFTRSFLERRLAAADYRVQTADNGREALRLVGQDLPDLVLSDWMIPEMDGRELCRQIKACPDSSSTYFILLTSRDQESDIVSALEAGADEYLIKPCEAKELLARVAAGIRIVGLQRELRQSNGRLNDALLQIDNELQTVANIQRAFLPQSLPSVPGVQFAAYYRPSSQCGGDYYDILPLPDGRLGIIIADISGHGTPAMVAMAVMRLLVHTHASSCGKPSQFLSVINRAMFEYLPTEQYATMFYGILDVAARRMEYSSAGQPPPLWWREDSRRIEPLPHCEGFPVKLVDPDVEYDDWPLDLHIGDRLLLYTDGVTDTINPRNAMYGTERLTDSLRAHRFAGNRSLDDMVEAMDEFAENAPQLDDVTFLELNFVARD